MIDLSRTLSEMLAAIAATSTSGSSPRFAATDARCLTESEASFELVGSSRDDLFPLLEVILSQRFAGIPRAALIRDLLVPLKNGLGNAYKHGNGRDRSKRIIAVVHFALRGACVTITDEGSGFDFRETFARFGKEEQYYDHLGAGFRNFMRSHGIVSFADGGRTFLLCYVPELSEKELSRSAQRSSSGEGSVAPDRHGPGRRAAASADLSPEVQRTLREILRRDPAIAAGTFGDLVLYGPRLDEPGGLRCVLTSPRGDPARVFTLQAFSSVEAAQAEYFATHHIYETVTGRKIRIPRPMALLETPPMVLFDQAPAMNLWTYMEDRGTPAAIERMSRDVGIVLLNLHGSSLRVSVETPDDTLARWTKAGLQASRCMHAVNPAAASRLESLQSTLLRRATAALQRDAAPGSTGESTPRFDPVVHGSFGWDCIHYGVNGRFSLSRFQHCRKAHPALDHGGFLADLLLYGESIHGASMYSSAVETLLESYGSGTRVVWAADLPLFVTAALLQRIPLLLTPTEEPGHAITQSRASRIDATRLVDLCTRTLDSRSGWGNG